MTGNSSFPPHSSRRNASGDRHKMPHCSLIDVFPMVLIKAVSHMLQPLLLVQEQLVLMLQLPAVENTNGS